MAKGKGEEIEGMNYEEERRHRQQRARTRQTARDDEQGNKIDAWQ